MSYREEAPVEIDHDSPHRDKTLQHPAFGCAVVSQWNSSKPYRMCGSDLGHHTGITVTIHEADLIRHLSGDRQHPGKIIAEFTLSLSQWSRLISSTGNGSGVPVTLRHYRDGTGLFEAPGIAAPEASKREVHGEEMNAALKRTLAEFSAKIDQLGKMIDNKSVKLTELREIHREMARYARQLPGNVQFIYDRFAEATEDVVEDAKTEVETYIDHLATRIGYDQLRQGAPVMISNQKLDQIE